MRKKLPVIIGKNLKKGVLAFRDMQMGGFNVCIVWLKKKYKSGDTYDMKDVEKIDAVLHFCDRASVEQTIKVLEWVLEKWKEQE